MFDTSFRPQCANGRVSRVCVLCTESVESDGSLSGPELLCCVGGRGEMMMSGSSSYRLPCSTCPSTQALMCSVLYIALHITKTTHLRFMYQTHIITHMNITHLHFIHSLSPGKFLQFPPDLCLMQTLITKKINIDRII